MPPKDAATEAASASDETRSGRRHPWLKRGVSLLLGLVLVATVASSLMPDPLQVDVAEARRGDLVVQVTADGVARLRERYRVLAPVSGELQRLERAVGTRVAAGETLGSVASLRRPPLGGQARAVAEAELSASRAAQRRAEAELSGLRLALAQAERELVRTSELHDRKVVSPAEAEAARLEAERLRVRVKAARFGRKNLQYRVAAAEAQLQSDSGGGATHGILSPIDGTVLRVLRRDAGPVAAGEPLLELGRVEDLEVVVDLLTQDAVLVTEGDPAIVSEWGGDPLPSTVERVAPTAFTRLSSLGVEEQRTYVTLRLAEPGDGARRLRDGYRVTAAIEIWRGHDVVTVPSSALFRVRDGWGVYRFDDGRSKVQPVVVGRSNGTTSEILEGIEPTDQVVLYPGERLRHGARIAPAEN